MGILKSIVGFFAPADNDLQPGSLGRNDPCWCGSNKKYKKCHLAEDERKARSAYTASCGKT
jgi:uncharacterized protein YecA (UPF0149 family)